MVSYYYQYYLHISYNYLPFHTTIKMSLYADDILVYVTNRPSISLQSGHSLIFNSGNASGYSITKFFL